jgi:MoaA/NifB/PqqE/SkfB family radical SAM enzyme
LIEPANDERSMYPWPRIVFWETTALCNLECSHCRRTDVPGSAPPDELSTAEAKRVIDEMAGWGRSLLILSGGEPLLRPDIFPLARHAAERGLIVALASNATLIDGSVSREIAECGIQRVSVSLDGADPATHDVFRRQPGAFASAMGGIEALRDAGVPVQINVTVARHNVGQMDEMAKLAKRLGAVALHLFLLVPVGCGVEIAAEQTISAAEYERTLLWLYETEQAEPDLQLKATCAPHYFRVVRQRQAAELRNVALLPSGQRQAAVATCRWKPAISGCRASQRYGRAAGSLRNFVISMRSRVGVACASSNESAVAAGHEPTASRAIISPRSRSAATGR